MPTSFDELSKLNSILTVVDAKRYILPIIKMNLSTIQTLAQNDMRQVNDLIYQQLQSDVALINQLGIYIVNGGVHYSRY